MIAVQPALHSGKQLITENSIHRTPNGTIKIYVATKLVCTIIEEMASSTVSEEPTRVRISKDSQTGQSLR